MKKTNKELFSYIEKSPTAFHCIKTTGEMLEGQGFQCLSELEHWKLTKGGKYYVKRNESSLVAFTIPVTMKNYHFQVVASHSDSPAFKVKENAEVSVRGKYTQLNTEGYGGMLCSTWFDRPLSIAGRVVVREDGKVVSRLLTIDRDLLMIPSVAIHMNRKANEGMEYNKQIDLLPLFTESVKAGGNDADSILSSFIAKELKVKEKDILGKDLFLYARAKGTSFGMQEEYIAAPRLDDLQCAFGALKGFMAAKNAKHVNVYACFDNEEVGSGTKQGAASTFLQDVLSRINESLGYQEEDYKRAIAGSFMVSADNAHAVHPNHPEKTDIGNCSYLNEGVVIKSHAGQKYTSDAISMAVFGEVCKKAEVPVQYFSNRSDAAGGSTLGNIAMSQVSMNCVDIGLPQLAMHSAFETAGAKDTKYLVDALTKFYGCEIVKNSDVQYGIE